jgi:hypothetical protein
MKHLKLFNSTTEYDTFKNGEEYILPNVSYIVNDGGVMFTPAPEEDVPSDITFTYYVPPFGGFSPEGDFTEEITVPAGTTFLELSNMQHPIYADSWYWTSPFPGYSDGKWGVDSEGFMCAECAPDGIGTGTLYLLKDGVRVKGSDVIEPIEYTLEISN